VIPPSKNIDFIVLTGPLGSGKTTLLEQLFSHHDIGSGTAVIVNEAGAVNIDGAVLVETANGLVIETLSNGCVCCSLGNDLVFTVQELLESRAKMDLPPFDRIILECSGLSMPGQVLRALAGLAHLKMSVSILCTYDCKRPPLDSTELLAIAAQLSAAQAVVLTKTDLVSATDIQMARTKISQINPMASVIDERDPSRRSQQAFVVAAHRPNEPPVLQKLKLSLATAHPRIKVFQATLPDVELEDVIEWLENITGALGERLLRCKALIPTAKSDVLIQTIGTTFSAPRALSKQEDRQGVAIFITQDCSQKELRDTPKPFEVSWVKNFK
jgi:G3E family GTPase